MKKLVYMGNCPIVDGFMRDCIYDLQRGKNYLIPKSLTTLIQDHHQCSTWEEIKAIYADQEEVLLQYFDFLRSHDLILFTEDYQNFPSISTQWYSPSLFTNAIIELGSGSNPSYIQELLAKLDEICCPFIEVRLKGGMSEKEIAYFIDKTNKSNLRALYLVVEKSIEYPIDFLMPHLSESDKLISISIFDHERTGQEQVEIRNDKSIHIFFDKSSLERVPKISISQRNISVKMFAEGKNYNTFFNRKLMIDQWGMIKLDFNSKKRFGAFLNISLNEGRIDPEYYQYWTVRKSDIKVCRDCEYRAMYVDSRIPVPLEDGSWKYETDCRYNPYLGKWEGESEYVPVSEMLSVT